MLLQAYDFLHLFDTYGCRIQIGASDQWGNITMGIDLVRKLRGQEAYGLTTPLVLRPDGTKFGKTESGTVWLDAKRTSPYQLYQFFLRTEDSVVGNYLRYLTFLDAKDIEALDQATARHPERREAQRALARAVVTLVHGEAETSRVERAAAALYEGKIESLDEEMLLEVCAEVPSSRVPRTAFESGENRLVDALVTSGLARSKSEARTLISQGGVYVNGRRVRDTDARLGAAELLFGRYVVLQRGREYHLLSVE
jgi:tyrosyl-tRNA synthetase